MTSSWRRLRRPLIAVACGLALAMLLSVWGSPSPVTSQLSTDVHCESSLDPDSGACPILSTTWGSEPGDWSRAANPAWSNNGKPVFFVYSSLACPYCASSSWVVWFALSQFGNWTGVTYAQSSPIEIYANTSSLDFSNATYSSDWVATDFWINYSASAIHVPTLSCPESAYASAYDVSEGVPFFTINGQFFHVGTLNEPLAFRANSSNFSSPALSAGAIRAEFENQSGPAWSNSSYQIGLVEAMMVIANGGRGPAAVLTNATVQQDIRSLTPPPPANFPLLEVIAGSGSAGALGVFGGAAFVVRRRERLREHEAEAQNPFRVPSITLDAHVAEPALRPIPREQSKGVGTPSGPSADSADDSMADLV